MLSPTRFVSSDCHPNYQYDFTSNSDIVRSHALRTIRFGDEITVEYGDELFDTRECLCKTCSKQKALIGGKDPILQDSTKESRNSFVHTLPEPAELPMASCSEAAIMSLPARKSFLYCRSSNVTR